MGRYSSSSGRRGRFLDAQRNHGNLLELTKYRIRKDTSTLKMKTVAGGSPVGGNFNFHPKLRLKRTRTCSSDSGCDVLCESPDLSCTIMEDATHTWEIRIQGVVKQEAERVREVTNWAKEALRDASEDEEHRQEVLESWRGQLEGIMEFTKDLVECVNNDTWEVMYDSMGLSSGHDSTSTLEEIDEEDDEKEEEIMQLFLLSAMGGNKSVQKKGRTGSKSLIKEFMSIYKKHGKVFKTSRKASKEVQAAYSKIKRQESFAKRQLSFEENKFSHEYSPSQDDFAYSQKMFDSVLESAEIFNDWHWNFDENQSCENIFADWRWNLEVQVDLKVKYYDDPEVETEWNEFNFWKFNDSSDDLKIDLDSGFLGDIEDEKDWTNCKFWQNTDYNENILHSLVDDEIIDDDDSKSIINFWDENMENQFILESLIEEEEKKFLTKKAEAEEFIWDEKDIALSLINIETEEEIVNPKDNAYIWNDLETLTLLLMTKDDEEPELNNNRELFPWEDPDYIKTLFNFEDQSDLISFTDDDENFLLCDDLKVNKTKTVNKSNNIFQDLSEKEDESINWITWPFWNDFGPTPDIMKAYEDTLNIQNKRHIDIMPKDNTIKTEPGKIKKTQKDPANIFKAYKHVFTIPDGYTTVEATQKKVKQTNLYEDMEDIYADWSLIALSDERTEKKRQIRGRKKQKTHGGPNKENEVKANLGHRRPGTPTIQTVTKSSSNKHFDFDGCWIETKVPKKERKTAHVWKNARSQKRLNAKIFAKQPRSIVKA